MFLIVVKTKIYTLIKMFFIININKNRKTSYLYLIKKDIVFYIFIIIKKLQKCTENL